MESSRKPPSRIDVDGLRQVAPSWESLVERQIREAMEAGKFDNLPFQGEPLPKEDDAYAGEWALVHHMLKNAGIAPSWIEADKDVRALLGRRDAILLRASSGPAPTPAARRRDDATLGELVVAVNAAVARLNAEAPTDRQHRRPLLLADELARYDEACRR